VLGKNFFIEHLSLELQEVCHYRGGSSIPLKKNKFFLKVVMPISSGIIFFNMMPLQHSESENLLLALKSYNCIIY